MKKAFKTYLVVWVMLLGLFNLVTAIALSMPIAEKYTKSFWIGYGFITLAFCGQLGCAYKALKAENLKKLFYNIPLLTVSYGSLIGCGIAGSICMVFAFHTYWVSILLCALVLVFNVFAVMKAAAAAETLTEIERNIKVKTMFIKALTLEAESLMARAEGEELKAQCKKVRDAIRFSDPMSSELLQNAESQIMGKFGAFSAAVAAGDLAAAQAAANETLILIEDRNKRCKMLK